MSIDTDPLDEVDEALGLTTEVIEDVIGDLKSATQAAVDDEDFDAVEESADRLRSLREFTTDVEALRARWREFNGANVQQGPSLFDSADAAEDAGGSSTKAYYGRAKRGTRTPEPEFRGPILRVLAGAGGSLAAAEALDAVGKQMASRLNDVDRQVLPSDGKTLRWRNTAQWARNVLADQGYIDRSVRGVWTITDTGRAWLERRS